MRKQTPFIPLNRGISKLPFTQAPIGSVRDAINFLVTEQGLIKRPGIKQLDYLDTGLLPGDAQYIKSQALVIDSKNAVAHFFYLPSTNTVKIFIRSTEDSSIQLDVDVVLSTDNPSTEELNNIKLIYLGNNEFFVYTSKGYVKLVQATANETAPPPNQWAAFEIRDKSLTLNDVTATQGDSIVWSFYLIGTPYILEISYAYSSTETLADGMREFRDNYLPILNELAAAVGAPNNLEVITYPSDTSPTSFIIHNKLLEFQNQPSGVSSNIVDTQMVFTLINALTNETYFGVVDHPHILGYEVIINGSDWQLNLNLDYFTKTDPNGQQTEVTSVPLYGFKGFELKGIELRAAKADKIRLVHNRVVREEDLPWGYTGMTVELVSTSGAIKTYQVTAPGTVSEIPIYINKEIVLAPNGTPDKVGFEVDITYGLKQIEFYGITTFKADGLTGSLAAQDKYIALFTDPINTAKYLVNPTVGDSIIRDVYYVHGRIAYVASKGVTFSKVNYPFELVPRNPSLIADDDPIDLALDGDMRYINSYDKYLIVFGKQKQYVISWQNYFSPQTVAATEVGAFAVANLPPAKVGNSLIFLTLDNELMEFYIPQADALPNAIRITQEFLLRDSVALIPVEYAMSVLIPTSDNKTFYWVYLGAISEEGAYRPISKWELATDSHAIGALESNLLFSKVRTIGTKLYVFTGGIDFGLISKALNNTLNEFEYLPMDWYQQCTLGSWACNTYGAENKIIGQANYDLLAFSETVEFYIAYPDYYNKLDQVVDIFNVTDMGLQFYDPNNQCIDTGSEYLLPAGIVGELPDTAYVGLSFTTKAQFQVPPIIKDRIIPTQRYNLLKLSLFIFGDNFTIKFFRRIGDTTPIHTRHVIGQITGLDYYDRLIYRDQVVEIRQPVTGTGLIEIETNSLDLLIVRGFTAVLDIRERGL